MFKSMRPFFRIALPDVQLDEREVKVWESVRRPSEGETFSEATAKEAYDVLSKAVHAGMKASTRTMTFLSLLSMNERTRFLDRYKNVPLSEKSVVTCMESIPLKKQSEVSEGRLVVGTESRVIYVVNPLTCSITDAFRINGTPVQIAPLGVLEVDYRILVLCREGRILIIKNGEVSGRVLSTGSGTSPVGMVCAGPKEIYVGRNDGVVDVLTMKGKKKCSIHLGSNILAMQLFEKDGGRGLLVALQNGEVRIYKRATMLYASRPHVDGVTGEVDRVMGFRAGRYGRSEMTLTRVYESGALELSIFKRRATLNLLDGGDKSHNTKTVSSSRSASDDALRLPTKTRVYAEQVQRERECASDMHRVFQRDLSIVRMASAEAYVDLIDTHGASIASGSRDDDDEDMSATLNAEVRGLGPYFDVVVFVENHSKRPLLGGHVTFEFDRNIYHFEETFIRVPVVIRGSTFKYKTRVRSIDENGAAGSVRIDFHVKEETTGPLISAELSMPLSEVMGG